MPWFAVKSLYRTDVVPPGSDARLSSFEERVVLFRASDFDEALRKAQIEARAYAEDGGWSNARGEEVRTRCLEALDAYALSEEQVAEGTEVYAKVLFVPPGVTDDELVERGIGQVSEQTSAEAASFEPDFASLSRRAE